MKTGSKAYFAPPPDNENAHCHRPRAAAQPAILNPRPLASPSPILIKRLGRADYEPAWHAMKDFTARRTVSTPDELRLLEHPPFYT